MKIGDTVFIIKRNYRRDYENIDRAIDDIIKLRKYPLQGFIVNIYESEDRSYHGIPHYDTIYIAQGADGKTYTDDIESYNRVSIVTLQDINQRIYNKMKENKKKIRILQTENKYIAEYFQNIQTR